MTPEEHRRLDALVAEKVMGWDRRNVGIREQFRFTPPDGESPTGAYPVDVGPGEEWSPSTDIAAAWEVVRHMSEAHDRWMALEYEGPDHCFVEFRQTDGTYFSADSSSAAHSICLAALACVGTILGSARQSYPDLDR